MDHANNAFDFLLNIVHWFVTFIFLLRLILQFLAVNMSNPISQAIFNLTQPVLALLQLIFPTIKGLNTAALVVLFFTQLITIFLQTKLIGMPIGNLQLLATAILVLSKYVLGFYFWTIILSAILSWLPNSAYNPLAQIANSITSPILQPIASRLPLIGGIDFSPIAALIIIKFIEILLFGG